MDHAVSTPRSRRRLKNEERILEAAMARVVEDGLSGLSMNKLAAEVDYTPGALYRYFDSKDALLSALVSRVIEEIRSRLAVIDEDDPVSRLFALVAGYRTFALEEPEKFGLVAMTMAEPRTLLPKHEDAQPAMQAMVRALGPLAATVAAAREARILAPGNDAQRALIIFAAVQGTLLLRKQARYVPELIDVHRMSDEALRALLVGWGADPAVVGGQS